METASMTSTAAPLIVVKTMSAGMASFNRYLSFVMTAIPTRAAIVMPIVAVPEPAILLGINKSELLR